MFQTLKCNKELLERLCESRRYKEFKHEQDLCLSVADADFQIPKGIKTDLIKRVNQGNISYTFFDHKMVQAVNDWYNYRYQFNNLFNCENLIFGSGVLHLMQIAINVFTKPGQGIIVQTPVYDPFYKIIANKGRQQISNPLVYNKTTQAWTIDFTDLEAKMQDPNNKLLFLCSPHNPVGRVWTKYELATIVDLAIKHDVFIVSDEIWQDIVFTDNYHIPIFNLSPAAKQCTFVISSPAKTYNLGGIQFGYGICFNDAIMEKLQLELKANIHYSSSNFLSSCCLISSYTNPKNRKWYQTYLKYLNKNFDILKTNIEANTQIKVITAQGLYLAWFDMSQLVTSKEELHKILDDNHIHCANGSDYGDEYWYFIRISYAVSTKVIKEIIKRFTSAFSKQTN